MMTAGPQAIPCPKARAVAQPASQTAAPATNLVVVVPVADSTMPWTKHLMILMAAFSKSGRQSQRETVPVAAAFPEVLAVAEAATMAVAVAMPVPRRVALAEETLIPHIFQRRETPPKPRLQDQMDGAFQMTSLMQKTMTCWRASCGKRLSVKPTLN